MTADEAFAWLKEVASTSEEVKCMSAWYHCQVMALRKQFHMMSMMAVVEQAVVSDVDVRLCVHAYTLLYCVPVT